MISHVSAVQLTPDLGEEAITEVRGTCFFYFLGHLYVHDKGRTLVRLIVIFQFSLTLYLLGGYFLSSYFFSCNLMIRSAYTVPPNKEALTTTY